MFRKLHSQKRWILLGCLNKNTDETPQMITYPLSFNDNTSVTLTYTFEKGKLQGELNEQLPW